MKTTIERLPKKTVKLTITIEKDRVSQTREHVIQDLVNNSELPGFRKGAAPRSLVESKLDKSKIRGEIINHLVPQAYDQAVKESLIRPLILPKIEIESFDDDGGLSFSALTCEAPEIKLGDYKTELGKLKEQGTKVILGPDGQPLSKNASEGNEEEKTSRVLEKLLEISEIEISDLVIDDEVDRMLGRLIDQTGRLGLTVDQYLQSAGKSVEDLKKDYRQLAEKNLKLEFILMAVAKAEGLKVEEEEISATINSAPDEESKKNLSQTENRLYLESVLIKNKVVQKLLEYTQ